MTGAAAEFGKYNIYEVYIDSLFLVNFVMNLYLYTLTAKSLKRTATRVRIFAGSFAGAFFSCVFILVPGIPAVVKRWIGPMVLSMAVTAAVYKTRRINEIVRLTGYLFIYAFLFGGLLKFLMENIPIVQSRQDSVWMILGGSFIGYQLMSWGICQIKEKKERSIYPVQICGNGNAVMLNALVDTGNSLIEPISGKPVSVVEEGVLEQLKGVMVPEKLKLIPYHSVGKANGMMEGYEVPEIFVEENGEKIRWQKVIVGISKNKISAGGKYQMILHPDFKR